MELEVFADAVENDDGIVDGITDDREERCDKRRINLPLRQRKDAEHDEDVMDECEHGRDAEFPFKTVRDVGDNQHPRNQQRLDGVRDELAADRRADFFLAKHRIAADVIFERRHDFLALILFEVRRADHDVFGRRDIGLCTRKLDRAAVEAVFAEARADVRNRDRLVKFQVDDRTTREIDAEVEAAHDHADDAGDDDDGRKEEPPGAMAGNIKFRHCASDPPFSRA